MKITALVENTTKRDGMLTEHGLSLYIETKKHKILFDMGQTELFEENANRLGVDISKADIAILSHGHYDHGGGLKRFLEINSIAPVYINRFAFGEYYNGTKKYIGLDKTLKNNKRIIFTDDELEIDSELKIFSCNERIRRYNLGSFGLKQKQNETFLDDSFMHEQYLQIYENGKKILISGCSHKGIIDIVSWFEPDYLIGGFHFSKIDSKELIVNLTGYLSKYDTEYYTCHCTGVEQYEIMKEKMGNLNYLACGDSITI